MKPTRTRYKFLGQTVLKMDVLGATFLRSTAGPFGATIEPLGNGKFSGRLGIYIPGAESPPTPFVTQPCASPREALRALEEKARETARAISRAVRAA